MRNLSIAARITLGFALIAAAVATVATLGGVAQRVGIVSRLGPHREPHAHGVHHDGGA